MAFVTAPNAVAEPQSVTGVNASDTLPFVSEQDAADYLHLIESIPDEVITQGDEAVAEWLAVRTAAMPRASFWGCAWALATVAIPAAKILKMRKAIKALGGARKAAQRLGELGWSVEAARHAGGAVWTLVEVISGVADVRSQCFE